MKRLAVTAFISLLFSSISFSQSLNTKKLDSLFDALESRGLATGSVAIAIDGKMIYQRAIGFARIDNNKIVPATTKTEYKIGSVTKMYTAALVFQLVEAGKLRLDNKLSAYFPQLPNAENITIADLLYHRSGLHDYSKDTNFPDWMDKARTKEELLQLIAEKGADFKPGEKYDYNNSNYLILGYIIEKVTHLPFDKLLQKNILSKAGLAHTRYAVPLQIDSRSYKYADSAWSQERETYPGMHGGAGSISSTAAELVKFIQQLFELKLITRASLEKMKTITNGYGMGIFPYDFDAIKGFGHNGRIEEFYTALRYFPEKKLAVSYITNGILFPRIEILNGILATCFNEFYAIPFSQPVIPNPESYTGEYASGALPFAVVCKHAENKLLFEFAGRSMDVEPISDHFFMHRQSGSFFRFDPEKRTLKIMETDNMYELSKTK